MDRWSDAGSANARVRDAEGKGIANAVVYLLAQHVVSPGAAEEELIAGQADRYGISNGIQEECRVTARVAARKRLGGNRAV